MSQYLKAAEHVLNYRHIEGPVMQLASVLSSRVQRLKAKGQKRSKKTALQIKRTARIKLPQDIPSSESEEMGKIQLANNKENSPQNIAPL